MVKMVKTGCGFATANSINQRIQTYTSQEMLVETTAIDRDSTYKRDTNHCQKKGEDSLLILLSLSLSLSLSLLLVALLLL